ncbi:MAG: FecR domain-containing protein, partial [Marinoscillum sp.]
MKHKVKNPDRIIAQLAKQSSKKELDEWLNDASKEEIEMFQSARKVWNKTELSNPDFEPNVNQAWDQFQLKLQSRQTPRTFPWMTAAAVVLLALASVVYLLIPASEQTIINQSAGSEVELIALPDGSHVWLSPNSSLSYAEHFADDQRAVHLSGKAFFEVAKRDGQRFAVYTKTTKTEVLGTSFNLDATQDDVSIQVTTGKVAFSDLEEKQQVLLTPGKQATYAPEKENKIIEKPIVDENYRAWQNKKLTFSNAKIGSLVKTLEHHYQTELVVSES